MDKIDNYMKNTIKNNFETPISYNNMILNSLNNKKAKKKYKCQKFIQILSTACAAVFVTCSITYAGFSVYEKIWKQPEIHNSLEEKGIYNKKIHEKDNKERLEDNKTISIDEAISISSNIFSNLEIEQNISAENVKVNQETYTNYFEIETNEYTMSLTSNGTFQYLKNKKYKSDNNYDDISNDKANELAEKILNSLNLKSQYSLKYLEETQEFINNKGYDMWLASYYETIDGLQNKYKCINISFNVSNNKIAIKDIGMLDDNFKFQNNEVIIDKEQAIETAKSVDRKISTQDISTVTAELSIERLNSFVYVQEKTLGKEDGVKVEIIDGVENGYYGYSNEKILRKVWNVKISYNYEKEKSRNSLEDLGRRYYIDATTGEVLGGSWGY